MDEVNGWGWQHATDQQRIDLAEKILDHAFDVIRPQGILIVQAFLAQAISSAALFQLEMGLLDVVRAIGRLIMQAVVQSLEPDTAVTLPRNVWFECGGYVVGPIERSTDPSPLGLATLHFDEPDIAVGCGVKKQFFRWNKCSG